MRKARHLVIAPLQLCTPPYPPLLHGALIHHNRVAYITDHGVQLKPSPTPLPSIHHSLFSSQNQKTLLFTTANTTAPSSLLSYPQCKEGHRLLANIRDSVELQFVGSNVVKEDEVNDWGLF